jgi:dipeptidyl aminopeptidase/acylaminoacyl peptidase
MDAVQEPSAYADPLIAEARRRARRRRALVAAFVVALAAAALFVTHRAGGSAADRLPRNGELTIIREGLRAVGGGDVGKDLWPCGPEHKCWEFESLAWNPDGYRFAFGGISLGGAGIYDGLHVVDLRTKSTTIIRPLRQGIEKDWLDLAWSADGTRLAYVTNWTIFIVQADGSGLHVLHTGTEGHDRAPTWSPDGARIAYATKAAGEERIYAIGVDGTTPRNVVARHASWPAWSPDGRTIAFRACGGIRFATPGGLHVRPTSSSGCAHDGVDGEPVWSPDGRKLAIGTTLGTYVMNRDGSGLAEVGPPPFNGIQPRVRAAWLRPAWRPLVGGRAVSASRAFPTGTFRTKITTTDLYNAGWRDSNDAHWETLNFRQDGTWRTVWSHPRVPDQPPAAGRYVVHGDTMRFLGTPDTVAWSYANGLLTFRIVHVPDRLARIGYTAHPWQKIR